MAVFPFRCRNTPEEIIVRLIGLKYSVSGVVFSSWIKPEDCWHEIFQASASTGRSLSVSWSITPDFAFNWQKIGYLKRTFFNQYSKKDIKIIDQVVGHVYPLVHLGMADYRLARQMPQRYCNMFFCDCMVIKIYAKQTLCPVCASLTKAMVHCICTYDTQLWHFAFVTLLPTSWSRVINRFSSRSYLKTIWPPMNDERLLAYTTHTHATQHNKQIAYQHYKSSLLLPLRRNKIYDKVTRIIMSATHTDKIILIFCEYKNHSKENITKINGDILNHSQGNFDTEIKKISWSIKKINISIQSWYKKIPSILQFIYSPDPVHQRWADLEIFKSESNPGLQKLNPIRSWFAKFFKIIWSIQSWSVHVKPCISFCLVRQNRHSFALHVYAFHSLRTSCLWWIAHSSQHQPWGCNNIPFSLQWTASITHSFCEGCIWHKPSQHHFVAIRRPEWQVRKASHCGRKATTGITRQDHSIIACWHHICECMGDFSHTSRSWWIAHASATQRQLRGFNNILVLVHGLCHMT